MQNKNNINMQHLNKKNSADNNSRMPSQVLGPIDCRLMLYVYVAYNLYTFLKQFIFISI